MSFVLIAAGASSRSPVRAVPVRPLLLVAFAASLVLLSVGGGLGYWMAVPQVSETPILGVAEPAPAPQPFTLEQLGAISGRLFRLESEAAQLSKRIGVPQNDPVASVSQGHAGNDVTPIAERAGARGGPLLPARIESALDPTDLIGQVARVEQQIARVADAAAERHLAQMRLPTRLPIAGAELTSSFGHRTDPFAHASAFHAGLDFAAQSGTPIASAAGGTVVFAGVKPDFGWVVEIDHGNGLTTRYAHASKLLVEAGQVVMPGDRIAMVGSTGRSTGPHLHFEVLRDGGHVDPKRYLAGL